MIDKCHALFSLCWRCSLNSWMNSGIGGGRGFIQYLVPRAWINLTRRPTLEIFGFLLFGGPLPEGCRASEKRTLVDMNTPRRAQTFRPVVIPKLALGKRKAIRWNVLKLASNGNIDRGNPPDASSFKHLSQNTRTNLWQIGAAYIPQFPTLEGFEFWPENKNFKDEGYQHPHFDQLFILSQWSWVFDHSFQSH